MAAPEHLSPGARAVWEEIVREHPDPRSIEGPALEAYCASAALHRDAQARVESEGMIVADEKGRPTQHPALAVAKQAQDDLRRWGERFRRPPAAPRRRRGPMVDALATSVTAAEHLRGSKEFTAAISVARTLAWQIDEAQRAGVDALAKASFGTIPTYLKALESLQITPATRPEVKVPEKKTGRVAHLRSVAGGGGGTSQAAR